jgi:hypothetical protein
MKKMIAKFLLVMIVSISLVGIVIAADNAVHNPKFDAMCIDSNGKMIESKDCDPYSCGCLFHEIGRFIKGMFD